MRKAAFFIIFFVFCPIYFPALAGNTPAEIILASEEWANATNKDGTGLYWDIFRAVYEPVGIKTKFIIRSYKGSVNLVKKNQVDAAVGIYPEEIKGALFSKYPFVKVLLTPPATPLKRCWSSNATFNFAAGSRSRREFLR